MTACVCVLAHTRVLLNVDHTESNPNGRTDRGGANSRNLRCAKIDFANHAKT